MQLRFLGNGRHQLLGNCRDQHIHSVKDLLYSRKPTFHEHGVSPTKQTKGSWARETIGLILYCSNSAYTCFWKVCPRFVSVSSLIKYQSFFCFCAVHSVIRRMLSGAQEKGALIITISIEHSCFVEGFFSSWKWVWLKGNIFARKLYWWKLFLTLGNRESQ